MVCNGPMIGDVTCLEGQIRVWSLEYALCRRYLTLAFGGFGVKTDSVWKQVLHLAKHVCTDVITCFTLASE